MQYQNRTPRSTLAIVMLTLLAGGLSCRWLSGDLVPEAPAPEPPEEPVQVEPPPADIPPPATGALNADGPWLLASAPEGLWAFNPDGSGATRLTQTDYWGEDLEWALQPGGNRVAFISPADSYQNLSLNLLTLPGGEVTKVTDLTSPETEAFTGQDPGEPGFEAVRALTYGRPAWSPDGTRLAFIGLMDGPSAEVYLYTAASEQVTRVSRDEAQNYLVSWSPDGERLLYFGAQSFGTGAGFDTTGVWSARQDGSNVTWLYVPEGGVEELTGWLDGSTAVLSTWTPVCGSARLRLYDVVNTGTTVLNEGCFVSAAANARRGEVLYATEQGLYLVTGDKRQPTQVSLEPVRSIDPPGPDDYLFTARLKDGGLATYGGDELDNQVSPVDAPAGSMDVAAYGLIWAWTSMEAGQDGVWITGPGMEIGQIYYARALAPIWDQRNNLLFFAPWEDGRFSLNRATFAAGYRDVALIVNVEASAIRDSAWLGAR